MSVDERTGWVKLPSIGHRVVDQCSDLTNDAPRRRTEPAITVTAEGPAYKPKAFGVGDRVHYYGDPKWLGTVVALDSDGDPKVKWDRDQCCTYGYYAERLTEHIEGRTFTVSAITAFTPTEAEACRSFGAAAYACMAADVEQVKSLARELWWRSLSPPEPSETPGDFAARNSIKPPKPGRRGRWALGVVEAMIMSSKLAKGEVVGG